MTKNLKKWVKENYMFIGLFVFLSFILVLVIYPICSYDYINYDSSYQYFLTQHSFSKIWDLLSDDYSPPLYALMLKTFCMLFGHSLKAMRAFSVVIMVGMIGLALFPMRRVFNEKMSIISGCMIVSSSYIFYMLPEIRPAILALFLITAAVVYATDICFNDNKNSYVFFTIFVILTMYTHNIGMIGCIGIFALMVIYSLIIRDYIKLKKIVFSGIICAIAYIPWLSVILKQYGNVKENFWVSNSTTKDAIYWMYDKSLGYRTPDYGNIVYFFLVLVFIFVILEIIAFVINELKNKSNNNLSKKEKTVESVKEYTSKNIGNGKKTVFLLAMSLSLVMAPILFHICVYPLLSERYMYIFAGIVIMLIASVISILNKRWVIILFLIGILCNGHFNYYCISQEVKEANFNEMVERIKNESNGNEISFLHLHEVELGTMLYYFPKAKHYIADETFTVLRNLDVFTKQVKHIGKMENIEKYTSDYYIVNDIDMTKPILLKNINNKAFEDKPSVISRIKSFGYTNRYYIAYSYLDLLTYIHVK